MKCPDCNQKLTSLTTVTWIMSSPEAKSNDKQVRRGMKDFRACYFCNKIFNIKINTEPLDAFIKDGCVCTKYRKCIRHHDLL